MSVNPLDVSDSAPVTLPRPLVVVTYGRSGSTLVQGLLNEMDGVPIRGENSFFILPLFWSYQRLSETRRRFSRGSSTRGSRAAWFGAHQLDPTSYAQDLSRTIARQLLGDEAGHGVSQIGFKEIRWYEVPGSQTGDFVDFLDVLLPDGRYILHSRDLAEVRRSNFWNKVDDAEFTHRIDGVQRVQTALEEAYPHRTFRTTYEQLVSPDTQADELRRLSTFVKGDTDAATLDRLRRAMEVGYGPHPAKRFGSPGQPID